MIDVELYLNNALKYKTSTTANASGKVDLTVPELTLAPSLDPYQVVYREAGTANYSTQRLFVVTPSILTAMDDLKQLTNRINAKLKLDDLAFTDDDYIQALKQGRDAYNGASHPTGFTMTNAQGGIYGMWMAYSHWKALRVLYLDEGRTSFDYQGAAVQLTSDQAMYIENEAATILDYISSNITDHKNYLLKFNLMAGDGSEAGGNGKGRRKRVPGATGVTAGPLTGYWGPLDGGIANNYTPRY